MITPLDTGRVPGLYTLKNSQYFNLNKSEESGSRREAASTASCILAMLLGTNSTAKLLCYQDTEPYRQKEIQFDKLPDKL